MKTDDPREFKVQLARSRNKNKQRNEDLETKRKTEQYPATNEHAMSPLRTLRGEKPSYGWTKICIKESSARMKKELTLKVLIYQKVISERER